MWSRHGCAPTQVPYEELNAVFAEMDTDGSGTLDFHELHRQLRLGAAHRLPRALQACVSAVGTAAVRVSLLCARLAPGACAVVFIHSFIHSRAAGGRQGSDRAACQELLPTTRHIRRAVPRAAARPGAQGQGRTHQCVCELEFAHVAGKPAGRGGRGASEADGPGPARPPSAALGSGWLHGRRWRDCAHSPHRRRLHVRVCCHVSGCSRTAPHRTVATPLPCFPTAHEDSSHSAPHTRRAPRHAYERRCTSRPRQRLICPCAVGRSTPFALTTPSPPVAASHRTPTRHHQPRSARIAGCLAPKHHHLCHGLHQRRHGWTRRAVHTRTLPVGATGRRRHAASLLSSADICTSTDRVPRRDSDAPCRVCACLQ